MTTGRLRQMDEAAVALPRCGELPGDALGCEMVLQLGELNLQMEHARGRDDRAAISAVDEVAKAAGGERDTAIALVREMGRDGQFLVGA